MLGTTTDGTTRGLREFKPQIFIVLQMGDTRKEARRDDNNNKLERPEREDFYWEFKGKAEKTRTICASLLVSRPPQNNFFPSFFCVE